jgi:hypothetical protein
MSWKHSKKYPILWDEVLARLIPVLAIRLIWIGIIISIAFVLFTELDGDPRLVGEHSSQRPAGGVAVKK